MWVFARLIPPGAAVITPRGPVDLPQGGAAWFEYGASWARPKPDSLLAGLEGLARFLTCLPALYPVNPARLLLVGFSQGAMLSNALAITRPKMVCGVASLAGAVPPLPFAALRADLFAGFPVFIAHGIRDQTIPLSAARQARDAYLRLGADVTYGEYSVGHKMNTRAMNTLQAWLGQHLAPQGEQG